MSVLERLLRFNSACNILAIQNVDHLPPEIPDRDKLEVPIVNPLTAEIATARRKRMEKERIL